MLSHASSSHCLFLVTSSSETTRVMEESYDIDETFDSGEEDPRPCKFEVTDLVRVCPDEPITDNAGFRNALDAELVGSADLMHCKGIDVGISVDMMDGSFLTQMTSRVYFAIPKRDSVELKHESIASR